MKRLLTLSLSLMLIACGSEGTVDPTRSSRPEKITEEIPPTIESLWEDNYVTIEPTRVAGKRRPSVRDSSRLVYSDIHAKVALQVATTTVTDVFRNDRDSETSMTYRFPLPSDATVIRFSDFPNGKRVDAKVDDKKSARKTYEKALSEGKKAALGESKHFSFSMELAPIAAHEARRVELVYVQNINPIAGRSQYVFPADHTNRNRPSVVDAQIELVTKRELLTLIAPNHADSQLRKSSPNAMVSIHREGLPLGKDLVVRWREQTVPLDVGAIVHKVDEEDAFVEAVFAFNSLPEHVVQPPRNIVFVVDASLSMSGDAFRNARKIVSEAATMLTESDQLGWVLFSDTISTSGKLGSGTTEASAFNKQLKVTTPSGSSPLGAAMDAAYELLADKNGSIVVLSDGQPTGESKVDVIESTYSKEEFEKHRVLVGLFNYPSLSGNFADRFSATVNYVPDGEAAAARVREVATLATAPVILNPKVEINGVTADTVHGKIPKQLAMGERIRLLARSDGDVKVVVKGELYGKTISLSQDASLETLSLSPLPIEWARARIKDQEAVYAKSESAAEKETLKKEVVALAKGYGIASRFTSYVAVDRLGPDHIKPGDPEIRINAPKWASKVYGVLPWGEVVECEWLEEEQLWYGRFLVSRGIVDGRYWLDVFVQGQGVTSLKSRLAFVVDSSAPNLTVNTERVDGKIIMSISEDIPSFTSRSDTLRADMRGLRRIRVRLPDGTVSVPKSKGENLWTLELPSSLAKGAKLHVLAIDGARNAIDQTHEIAK